MITKDEVDQVFEQLKNKNAETAKKVDKIQNFMSPEQKLEDKIQSMKTQNMKKTAKYAQTFFWTLNTHVSSYRMINQGLVQKGG